MDTFAEVLHHLVDNCAGFVAAEAQKAHALITDELGGDRHHSVPDPDDPEAGAQSDDNADAPKPDNRDVEIARLRAELADRDSRPPAPAESPAPAVSAPATPIAGADQDTPVPTTPAVPVVPAPADTSVPTTPAPGTSTPPADTTPAE